MKDIPVIFPLSLLVIILFSFFTGAYAISEDALSEEPGAVSAAAAGESSASGDAGSLDHEWYQNAAIWVCPLH